MEKVFGIDVSKWQGNFNFTKAKNEGVQFAILRAGYTGSSKQTSKAKDEKFETYYKNAKANNIGVGAYWFSRATTYDLGKAEAEYMYNNCLKGKQFEYPIYIDVEDTYYQSKVGKKAVTEAIKGFCEYLESKGFYVGIYANSNWFKNHIDTNSLTRYDKWVANWSKTKPSTPSAGMWQFGGETNILRSNKITGVVCDQDYAYKDYPLIMKQKGINGYNKEIDVSTSNIPNSSSSAPNLSQTVSTNTTNIKSHKVVKGDSISKICIKYYGKYTSALGNKIVSANKARYSKITLSYIQIGWTLTIPS